MLMAKHGIVYATKLWEDKRSPKMAGLELK